MRSPVLLAAWLLIACGDEPPPLPEGPHYQYAVSELHLPSNNIEARQYGQDLDGNEVVDNQLGMVFATLDGAGLGVDGTAREALLRGGLIMLADFQTLGFDTARTSGLTTYLGQDPQPAPCIDPAQLATCGQHLLGTGEFVAQDGQASTPGVAPVVDGEFTVRMERLPVELALVSAEPIRVVLHAARVRMTGMSPTGGSALIAGGIAQDDVDSVVIPEAAAQMDRIVTDECGQPNGSVPCGCIANSRADLLDDLFDYDADCRVTADELRSSSLVAALLSPDITVEGEPLLSFGLGVELVSAAFPRP